MRDNSSRVYATKGKKQFFGELVIYDDSIGLAITKGERITSFISIDDLEDRIREGPYRRVDEELLA